MFIEYFSSAENFDLLMIVDDTYLILLHISLYVVP